MVRADSIAGLHWPEAGRHLRICYTPQATRALFRHRESRQHAMGYRSIKRVLGETNLERKCRLLFGFCLLVLIATAFFWVNRVAENLVIEATRNKASDNVVMLLMRSHFISFETDPNPEARVWTEQLSAEFEGRQVFTYEILKLESQSLITQLEHAKVPASKDMQEWQILRDLQTQHQKQLIPDFQSWQ